MSVQPKQRSLDYARDDAASVIRELSVDADDIKAKVLQRFFKTGKGEYGYGDVFIGVTVPKQRIIAKRNCALPLLEIKKLLHGKVHEHRLTALLILVEQFEKGPVDEQKRIVDFYLQNISQVNNWDLVDLSAPKILGQYLCSTKSLAVLTRLVRSKMMWERRIAIIATFAMIRKGHYRATLRVSRILLYDPDDLIHKAVGWMLREVGKRDQKVLESFLYTHASRMPRTMLRYAIERFDEATRKKYRAIDRQAK